LVKGIQTNTANSFAGTTSPQSALHYYSMIMISDINFLFIPHRFKGAYGLSSASHAGAILKLRSQDLGIEWCIYSSGSTLDDSIENMALLKRD